MTKKSKVVMMSGIVLSLLTGCTNNTNNSNENIVENTESRSIPFDNNENNVVVLKAVALKQYEDTVKDVLINNDSKDTLELYYDYVVKAVEQITGDANEVKEQLNILYSELLDTIDFIQERVTTYLETREHALKEIKRIVEAVLALSNSETIPYINNIFESYKKAITEIVEEIGYKDEIDKLVNAFRTFARKYIDNVIDEALARVINEAKSILASYYEEAICHVTNEDIKSQLDILYNDTYLALSSLVDKENITTTISSYIETFKSDVFALGKTLINVTVEEAIKYATNEVDKYITNALTKVEDETLRFNLESLYDDTKVRLEGVRSKEAFLESIELIVNDVKENVLSYVKAQLEIYKTKARTYIDEQFNHYVELITYEDLKASATEAYNKAITALDEIVNIDNSIEDISNITTTLGNDLVDIFQTFCNREIDKLRESTYQAIEEMFNAAYNKLDDEKYKEKLKTSYDEIVGSLRSINNYDTAIEEFENIKNEVSSLILDITNEAISDVTGATKTKVSSIFEQIVTTVPALREIVEPIYNDTINLLNGISSLDGIHDTCLAVYNEYKDVLDPYISETIEKIITIGKATLKQEYDYVLSILELDVYKEKLDNIFNNLNLSIEKFDDILTISSNIYNMTKDFINDMVTFLNDYFKEFASYYKGVITEKAQQYIDEVKASDVYKQYGTIKKWVMNGELKALYNTFMATINNLTSDETAKAVCNKAYEELVKAIKQLVFGENE